MRVQGRTVKRTISAPGIVLPRTQGIGSIVGPSV
jgi:hypothetical protein